MSGSPAPSSLRGAGGHGRRALVGAPFLPAYDRESGNQRIYDLVDFLLNDGWSVTFVAKRPMPDDARHGAELRRRGVATFVAPGQELKTIIQVGRFDLAVFAFWFTAELFGSLVRSISPSTRIVVDPIDLHFLRESRRRFAGGQSNAARVLDPDFANLMARELNVYAAADAVLAVSRKEADLINDLTGASDLAAVLPDNEQVSSDRRERATRRGMVFIGNCRHPPNVEAARHLVGEVVPRLDRDLLAEHPIRIVGNETVTALAETARGVPGVRVVGWVPSVYPYLEHARIALAPLLHGAGTKRKMIQSLMVGTPTVSTRVGIEGLPVEHEREVLVAEGPDEFAAAVTRLAGDDELWERLSVGGQERLSALYGRERVESLFHSIVERTLATEVKSPFLAQANLRVYRKNLYREYLNYSDLTRRLRQAVLSVTSPGAAVAVVSKGDDGLVGYRDRRGIHFPAAPDGSWLGYYPADGADALDQLAVVREMGATLLAVPSTATWWLTTYPELAAELRAGGAVFEEETTGVIFAIGERGSPGAQKRRPADP